jgi:hypothetical protein
VGRRPVGSTRGGLARGGQKGGFKTAFEAEIVAEIETLVGTGTVDDWDFEAIETFGSVLGPLTLSRAYYHCKPCKKGFCPRDHALGLQDGSLSPGVLRMVVRVGAMVRFEEGHELLAELAGVEVPTKHVERAAEALGREVAEDERRVVEPPAAEEPLAPTLSATTSSTPAISRPAARPRSERGASAPACIGPSPGLTRSSPCAAAS